NGVLGHYEKHQIPYTVHVVTRLDRDTSGLLLIAKHRYSHSLLSASQKAGKVRRKYQAVTEGHLQEKEGSICLPIGRKEGSIIERTVTDAGKPAITAYRSSPNLHIIPSLILNLKQDVHIKFVSIFPLLVTPLQVMIYMAVQQRKSVAKHYTVVNFSLNIPARKKSFHSSHRFPQT